MPRSYVLCRLGRLVRELRFRCVVDTVIARVVLVVYDLIRQDGTRDTIRERITPSGVIGTTPSAGTRTSRADPLRRCDDEFLNISIVIVEMERALFERHHACVDPVGDAHLVILQQGAHRVAQQRGVVAGERRAHQHDRLILQLADSAAVVRETLETQQTAERLLDDGLFDDRDVVTILNDLAQVEFGLFVVFAQPVEQFVTGGKTGSAWDIGKRAGRFAKDFDAAWAQAVSGLSRARWNSYS